ncbi:hypothetical protein F2Q69_00029855 [Brassica cretica]|uniref:Uncharacterized protein n=1 Tax=Brassica cretica TaxID=69181 RepID=A0A8S9SAC4_BRACR|nr:hypothetical protein F2Q69_00029855 [Brassica cretica]
MDQSRIKIVETEPPRRTDEPRAGRRERGTPRVRVRRVRRMVSALVVSSDRAEAEADRKLDGNARRDQVQGFVGLG